MVFRGVIQISFYYLYERKKEKTTAQQGYSHFSFYSLKTPMIKEMSNSIKYPMGIERIVEVALRSIGYLFSPAIETIERILFRREEQSIYMLPPELDKCRGVAE